jgi:hypothetical protein
MSRTPEIVRCFERIPDGEIQALQERFKDKEDPAL